MENNALIEQTVTSKEKGDSLEMAIEHLFKVANFKTERNVIIAKYQIDVKAKIGDRTILIECKNYQSSSMTIRNLIHQWNSKNQIIKAHKIIIVLAGLSIKESDHSLASEFDIELWDQDDISELFNLSLSPEKLRNKLLEKISLKSLSISERYRDDITYIVIKTLMSNQIVSNEILYKYFNKWLRAFILTELQMATTTRIEREKLIELFEGNKTKKGFLNISSQRKETEYWNAVREQLSKSELLSRKTHESYLSYMNDLVEEYENQQSFFQGDDFLKKSEALIKTRLQNALIHGQMCRFTTKKMRSVIIVDYPDDGYFSIQITGINENDANVINWIMTSESESYFNEKTNLIQYYWFCSSFNETSEKVFRIFTEYHQIATNETIIDLVIK